MRKKLILGGNIMDLFKLNLGSKLMKKIAAKLIIKFIKKHFEVNPELELDQLEIKYVDGDAVLRTSLELRVDKKEVKKLLRKLEDEIDDI